MDNLVSIIMPSYNTRKYIEESINSVLKQTYSNWELIIIDDCSIDDTDIIVKPYLSDKRIRYLKNKKNKGAAVSRNRALREIKGKWIAFLDSDDLWKPQKLERHKSKSGVVVKGVGDVAVRFSKCCNPVPGDEPYQRGPQDGGAGSGGSGDS